jgi:Cd2+/Zn2+-exporting ATPase
LKGEQKMKQKFTITGLDCPNCAAKLAKMMENIEGVESAKINFLTEKLTVESSLPEDELLSVLSKTARSFEDGVVVEK